MNLSGVSAELLPLAQRLPKIEMNEDSLRQMRTGDAPWVRDPLATVPYAKMEVPSLIEDDPSIVIYVINQDLEVDSPRPVILHTHGGGFVTGSAKNEIARLQELAAELDVVVVSVEYRLAPETTFEGSIEDNYSALVWIYQHAEMLGIDKSKIALMGESAGGGHAALLAIIARDRGEVPVMFQLLIQPMLDDRTGSSRPVPDHIGQILWTRQANQFGWSAFLGQAPGTDKVPRRAVPARTLDLSGLPPTYISIGSIDLFVQEGVSFAKRLIEAGIPTELHIVPGAFHGFDQIAPDTELARAFAEDQKSALLRAFNLEEDTQ